MSGRIIRPGNNAIGRGFSRPGAVQIGGMENPLGGLGGGFVPDAAPSPYRTTTQTMVAGRYQTCALGLVPQLSSEFSISVWCRHVTALEAWIFSIYEPTAAVGVACIGDGIKQAFALHFPGNTPATISDQNRLAVMGTDQAGNKLSASTIPVEAFTPYGFRATETLVNNGSLRILLTAQVRSGNVEVWATYRGMAPRLMIQQAVTWTGTSGPLPVVWGGANVGLSANGTMELEQPTVLSDRSLSQNEIAQLSLGISPEDLNSASSAASATIRFAAVTDGTTTTADRSKALCPADGDTLTLNGDVYTFRTSPSLGTEIQTYSDFVGTMSYDATTDTFTTNTAHGLPNGRRVAIDRSTMPGGIDAQYSYYIINTASTTFQLSWTPGGAAIDITTTSGLASTTISSMPTILDAMCTTLNALTASSGGASNATYAAFGQSSLVITHRTAGGTSFTFDSSATNVKSPTAKRLALAWAFIVDYTGFRTGLFGAEGTVRRRSGAWVSPPGTALAPNTQVTGALLINSWQDGMVNHSVSGTSKLKLSGIYTGNAPTSGGKVKVYDLNGLTQVQAMTALGAFTTDSGAKTWNGTIDVPATNLAWCAYETQKTGSSYTGQVSEARVGFGILDVLGGRSHLTDVFNQYSNNDLVPNGFSSQYCGPALTGSVVGAYSADSTWHRYTTATSVGSGIAVYCDKLSAANNCPVGIYSQGIGGTVFDTLINDTTGAAHLAALQTTQVDAARQAMCGVLVWCHSGEDYLSPDRYAQLRTWVDTYLGTTIPIQVCPDFTARNSADNTVGVDRWLTQQVTKAKTSISDPLIIDGGDFEYVYNTIDGVHATAVSVPPNLDNKFKGERWAQARNFYLGNVAYSAEGPTLASAVRTGASIELTWNLNGATTLQVSNAGADVTGVDVAIASSVFDALVYAVTVDNTTDTISASGHTINDGDPLVITATSLPGGLSSGNTVYARDVVAGTSFKVADTVGGAAKNITSNGSGVYVFCTRDLLTISSHTITAANKTTITLSADPGAACIVRHRYGRPGKQNAATGATSFDPAHAVDATGQSAMTAPWTTAQSNPLCDDWATTYTVAPVIGRIARKTLANVSAG